MPAKITPESEIVREYLKRFPSSSSYNLARILFEKHPSLFTSQEKARDKVRYYRGSRAGGDGSRVSDKSRVQRIVIPVSEPEEFGFFHITGDCYPIIVGGDAHIPYHDQDALEMFIERAVEIGAKTVILAGDWIDMYQVSRFSRDPRLSSVKQEIETFREIIKIMREALPDARIIYKLGNHEERYNDYLMRVAPEIFELDNVRLEGILNLDDFKVEVVKHRQVIKIGHLHIIHGHEYTAGPFGGSVNPARGLYLKAKKSSIMFHQHQTSDHTESSINGDIVSCWSGGCLCGLHPQYAVLNKWNLGFIEIYSDDDGMFSVKNRKIISYRLV